MCATKSWKSFLVHIFSISLRPVTLRVVSDILCRGQSKTNRELMAPKQVLLVHTGLEGYPEPEYYILYSGSLALGLEGSRIRACLSHLA